MNTSGLFKLALIIAVLFNFLFQTGRETVQAETDDPQSRHQRMITELDFWQDHRSLLHASFLGRGELSHLIQRQDETRLEVLLPGTKVPPEMVRLYRLDNFDTSVKSLFIQNTEPGARLIWTWDPKTPFDIHQKSDSINFRFDRPVLETGGTGASTAQDRVTDASPWGRPEAEFFELNALFPGMKQEYTGDPISIDLQNAEVEHVLRLITAVTDYNLILDEDVRGRISMRLVEVPWDQALDLVLVQKNLGMVVRGNIIRVTTAQKLEAERDQARRAREAAAQARESMRQLEPLEQEFIQINYATAQELLPQIQNFLSDRGKVTHDVRTNTLIIQDTASNLREINALIANLDRPEKQVYIEARVVYATEEFRRGLGIQWSFLYPEQNAFSPSGDVLGSVGFQSMNFPRMADDFMTISGSLRRITSSLFTIDAQLRLGETQNISRTISAPRVITLNNQRAEIEQGIRIPIQVADERGTRTDYEDAVLRLIVEPQITPDNKLILDLEIRDDSPAAEGIETKLTKTKLFVEDGETIVIGGIKKVIEEELENRIPGLGGIPFLGWLFKNQYIGESKNELLIFIRPEIL